MSWVDEQLFVILNYRLTHALPTIFTTNLKKSELNTALDMRVARRLDTATIAWWQVAGIKRKNDDRARLRALLAEGIQGGTR